MHIVAAVSRGPHSEFTLEPADLSAPEPDEILVRIVATGICHTDLGMKAASAEGTPAVFGHEGAGVVVEVGTDITDVSPGDHVLLSYNSCGQCVSCIEGEPAYCRRFGLLNAAGTRPDGSSVLSQDGSPVWSSFFGQSSFASHVLTTRRNTVVVDSSVDLAHCAAMGCGFQTGASSVVNIMKPQPDSSVVVFGAGGVGCAAIMAAKALGVRTVVAVDLSEQRRVLAGEIGADSTLDGAAPDLHQQIVEITGGGATYAFDTTAVPAVVKAAALALAPGGLLVVVGVGPREVPIDITDLISNGKTIRGSIEGDADPQKFVPQLVDWYRAGRFPVDKIVTVFPFADFNDAVRSLSDGVIKAVVEL